MVVDAEGVRRLGKGWKSRAGCKYDQPTNPLLLEHLLKITNFAVGEFEFFQRVGFLTDSTGSSQTEQLLTFSFAWISRSFLRASTWMWELTWKSKNYSLTKTDAMLEGISTISRILFVPLLQIQLQLVVASRNIMVNGNLLACSRLAGSKLDVPCYQLVPS